VKHWCFDLFITLVDIPGDMPHERGLLGVGPEDWRRVYECAEITSRHDRGLVTDPVEMVRELTAAFGVQLGAAGEREFLCRREARFHHGLTHVRPEILDTLRALRLRGCALCLVSNADAIDILHWADSPLAPLFDHVIFSCRVGMLKPEPGIYQLAAGRMGVSPRDCVFVGDGGSDELAGAKAVGMRTIQARHFARRDVEGADFTVDEFRDTLTVMEALQ